MRFDNYIVIGEETDRLQEKANDIVEMLFKDCSYYINQLRKSNAFTLLYRSSQDSTNFYKLKTSNIERGRKPKDMGKEMHRLLNDKIFRPTFGWNVRDGIFASSKILPYYGEPYLFFPIGEFEYVWSPTVSDLYDDMLKQDKLDFLYWYSEENWLRMKADGDKIIDGNIVKTTDEDIEKDVKNLQKMYQNNDFKMAVRSKHEISFKCDKYYIVNRFMTDNFERWMLDLIYHPEKESKFNPFKVSE